MKLRVEIQTDGLVHVHGHFAENERPGGNYMWATQFVLFRYRETGELMWGIAVYGEVVWTCYPKNSVKLIESMLENKKFVTHTHLPAEPTGSGFVKAWPMPETNNLKSEDIEVLKKQLTAIGQVIG